MKNVLMLSLVLLISTPGIGQTWTTMSIETHYPRLYHETSPGVTVQRNEMLHLRSSVDDQFFQQVFANAHVLPADDGDWLIMGYGDDDMWQSPNEVGDAIHVISRHATQGHYVKHPTALRFAPLPGQTWAATGGLGAGAGFAKTTTPTIWGYKYFAIVPVFKKLNSPDAEFWITWAASPNGKTGWVFMTAGGGVTTDAAQSVKLIRRNDVRSDPPPNGYQHIAMFYNSSPEAGTGYTYFYVVLGYANSVGWNATWWRIRYNSGHQFGLATSGTGFDIQRKFNNGYVQTNGIIPDHDWWTVESSESFAAVDPSDLTPLYRQDGTLDSIL